MGLFPYKNWIQILKQIKSSEFLPLEQFNGNQILLLLQILVTVYISIMSTEMTAIQELNKARTRRSILHCLKVHQILLDSFWFQR